MSNSHPAPAVVVGVDGSRAATQAALWAIDEAVSRDIPMRLVYVIDPRDASTARACEARLAAARTALADAHRSVDATGVPVKIETDILCGRPLTKLMEESRSAALICVGSIGLNHACHGGTSVATSLARSARCPVAVIHQPARRSATPKVSSVLAEVDNGMVLRHAFEEARLRGATVRALWVCRGDGRSRCRRRNALGASAIESTARAVDAVVSRRAGGVRNGARQCGAVPARQPRSGPVAGHRFPYR